MELKYLNINTSKNINRNMSPAALIASAVRNGEGTLSDSGALVVKQGNIQGDLLKIDL